MVGFDFYEMCFLKKISEPDMLSAFYMTTRFEVKNCDGEVLNNSRRVVAGSRGIDECLVEQVYNEIIEFLKKQGWELSDDILHDGSIILRKKTNFKIDLETPCKVSITRLLSNIGEFRVVRVFLNGVEKGILKNGEMLDFTTFYSANELIVETTHGKNPVISIKFIATSGGYVNICLDFANDVLRII